MTAHVLPAPEGVGIEPRPPQGARAQAGRGAPAWRALVGEPALVAGRPGPGRGRAGGGAGARRGRPGAGRAGDPRVLAGPRAPAGAGPVRPAGRVSRPVPAGARAGAEPLGVRRPASWLGARRPAALR